MSFIVHLHLIFANTNKCIFSPEKLDVRLGFDLCDKEKVFLEKRQRRVADTLKKVLQLKEDLVGEEVRNL